MNLWKQFSSLQTGVDLRVGKVISIDGSESVIEEHGGRQFRAIGTGVAVGNMAYVKNGLVQSEAPNLPDYGIQYV